MFFRCQEHESIIPNDFSDDLKRKLLQEIGERELVIAMIVNRVDITS